MDKNEKDALLIETCLKDKWYPMASSRIPEECRLCREYDSMDELGSYGDCQGCPIEEDTGKQNCRGTPYDDYVNTAGYSAEEEIAIWKEIAYLHTLAAKLWLRVSKSLA